MTIPENVSERLRISIKILADRIHSIRELKPKTATEHFWYHTHVASWFQDFQLLHAEFPDIVGDPETADFDEMVEKLFSSVAESESKSADPVEAKCLEA